MSNDERTSKVADLLHEAAETHHIVFRITDGADDDRASWYSDWLVNHSKLGEILGTRPVRSELTHELVALDRQFTTQDSAAGRWEDFYATRLLERLA
jgi:hypothetical protein